MANECLVTKLKDTVNNENLYKLGILSLKTKIDETPDPNSRRLKISTLPGKSVIISCSNGGYVNTNYYKIDEEQLQSVTITGTEKSVFIKNGAYDVEIDNKYNISGILDFSCIDREISINIEQLFGCPLTIISLTSNMAKGDLNSLSTMNTLEYLTFFSSKNVVGLLKDISHNINLTNMIFYNTGVRGSVEDFVVGQIEAGRTTQTIETGLKCYSLLRNCTFGLKNYSYSYICLTWESSSKIAFLNYTNNTYEINDIIICKGYTQEEAEAKWPDKTIIRVDA